MATVQIEEENVRKAYKEGCSDVKKVLETLFPEIVKNKYPCFIKVKEEFKADGGTILFVESESHNPIVIIPNKNNYRPIGYQYSLSYMNSNHYDFIEGIQEIQKEYDDDNDL